MNSTSFSFCIGSRSLRVSPLITVHHTERNAGVSSKAGFSSIFKKNSAEVQQDAIALMLTEYGMNEASLPKAENANLQEGPGKKREENQKNDQEEMVLK